MWGTCTILNPCLVWNVAGESQEPHVARNIDSENTLQAQMQIGSTLFPEYPMFSMPEQYYHMIRAQSRPSITNSSEHIVASWRLLRNIFPLEEPSVESPPRQVIKSRQRRVLTAYLEVKRNTTPCTTMLYGNARHLGHHARLQFFRCGELG